jgi:D-alanyl-D-alanine carboxypeptidase/D-alanyl-D-alanine-endopeptidase (penicillin-binding protein 4)
VLLTAGYVIADIADVAPGLLTVNTAVLQGQPGPRAAIPAGAVAAAKAERDVPINADKANALLDRFAEAEGVGSQYSIAIADQRGSVIAQRNDGTPREPASTLKTLTALAAASSLDMGSTFSTETYLNQPAGGPDTITLKGNGDMLLGRGASDPKHVNGRAGLETLAQQTARGLRQRGIATVALAMTTRCSVRYALRKTLHRTILAIFIMRRSPRWPWTAAEHGRAAAHRIPTPSMATRRCPRSRLRTRQGSSPRCSSGRASP